jgi:hypothetical protein
MTNRMDHTGCTHAATPAARKVCRADRRNQVKNLQRAYMDVDAGTFAIAEYEAMVDLFSMRWGMDLRDAYQLIEEGPVVF